MARLLALVLLLAPLGGGCMFVLRSPIERGMRVTNDRFDVVRLNRSQLSPDQRRALDESGTPDTMVFEEELKTGLPVQRWVYSKDKLQYVFLDGRKVDYVVVASSGRNPLLEAANSDQGPLLIAWQWLQLVGHWLRD
ncbi:MAG: hypothetical protein HY904_16190 [Deltaproteobacteria bacterium]|nr:hypothetical protein [Deltaproteobacteria bacterium]